MDLGQRHLAGALAINGFDDVAIVDLRLIGRPAGDHRYHRCVAERLGDGGADVALAVGLMRLVHLVLFGVEIAGIRVERLQQAMQRAVGDQAEVRLFHVFAADARQHFAIDADLPVGALVLVDAGGADVQSAHHGKGRYQERRAENDCLNSLGHDDENLFCFRRCRSAFGVSALYLHFWMRSAGPWLQIGYPDH